MGKFIDFLLARPNSGAMSGVKNRATTQATGRQTASSPLPVHYRNDQPYDDMPHSSDASIHIDNRIVYDEIQKLKLLIETGKEKNEREQFAGLYEAMSLLRKQRVDESLITAFMREMEVHNTIEKLQDIPFVHKALHSFLNKKIIVYKRPSRKEKQRRIIFVGASGVGKTSVMLKIATYFNSLGNATKGNIRIANFDRQKIGAKEYLKKVTECMEIEGESFFKIDDLQAYKEKGTRPEIFLVDTSGKNPKNKKEILSEIRMLENITLDAETFLVLPANSSEEDMRYMLREFKALQYTGVIITKIDEAVYPATVMGLCLGNNVPIVFMSNGKATIPDNLLEPTREHILGYFNI